MTEHQPELIPQTNATITPEEQAKRDEYRRRLAEYLKDPAFRAIEGFPIGTDEDILALSDPPYYTACPNPFLPEILTEWQQEREETRKKLGLKEDRYQREPFAADVSEGKNDPIYNAHSYHTKVPHKAIMRYILHYTDPGDIVFDGFCGTGMTGVAAQLCGDKKTVESLGYRVDGKDMIWEGDKAISRLGARKAVLNDLSPAATFIAYNYNTPVDTAAFERDAKQTLKEVEQECGWMYETWHPNCVDPHRMKGKINYTIWSDVYMCPNCGEEMIFWEEAMDLETQSIRDTWNCRKCNSSLSKDPDKSIGSLKVERVYSTVLDPINKTSKRQAKYLPVLINYTVGKRRYEKKPDSTDIKIIEEVNNFDNNYFLPRTRIDQDIDLWYERDYRQLGIYTVDGFFTRRNLLTLANLNAKIKTLVKWRERLYLTFVFTSIIEGCSKLNRERPKGRTGKLSGTLYIGGLNREITPIDFAKRKVDHFIDLFIRKDISLITTQSLTDLSSIADNSVDYIFVDPPFGSNIIYSDLSILWESWLNIFTNTKKEAVVHRRKKKSANTIDDYRLLLYESFNKAHKSLKPGNWITVEFHNTQNSVWNAIQDALQRVGFVIADVSVLDKQQTTFKQSSTVAAVKQDLIISAYKPNGNLEERFKLKAGTEDGAWEFVRYHLGKLPMINESNGVPAVNAERQAFLLFDRMVAFHIQRGVMVPLSAPEFYAGLEQRFIRRDGMYFLPDQVAEYDRAMLDAKKPVQLTLFVNDEKTAITWLRQQLDPDSGGEPKTQGDLTNDFNRVMNRAKHEQPLELIEILKQNFLQNPEGKWYVPDHNKASDLEKVRQRTLLREFKEYTESAGRLRVFRSEAVRAGFADCFKHQDYETIVTVAERLPEDVLREDPDLLMYYDSALLRKK